MTRAERIAFIEEQLSYGFTAADIAADLDRSPAVIERTAYRAGRPDLAAIFRRIAPPSHLRKGRACTTCGKPCSDRAERCFECIRHLNNDDARKAAS